MKTRRKVEARKSAAHKCYPKGEVSRFNNSFVVIQTLVFQIKFCGKNPAHHLAAMPLSRVHPNQC
jgi:hypothetical protein